MGPKKANTAASKADMTLRNGAAPNLRLVGGKLPRIGQKTIEKAILCLPGYDPHAGKGDCIFDWKAGQKAVRFFHEELSHVKGELGRQPFILERWQIGIIANLFGWMRPDGTRRYREAFVFVPRKNGKTPMAAGVVDYMLFEDNEPGAEIYGAAAKHEQACLVFAHARGMILQNAELTEKAKIFNGAAKCIESQEDFGMYKAIASDADTSHGYNASGIVADELHAWKRTSDLLDVLETSMGARRQPLLMTITTSDFDRQSACNDKYDYAIKVRDGLVSDPAFLPVIYEASVEDDWTDRKVWKKANPNLGVSLKWEYLERMFLKAQAVPSFENTFKRLHLNIRTEQDVRWIPLELWDSCRGEIDLDELEGCPCFGALDLASTSDITAFMLLFSHEKRITLVPYFWVPADSSTRAEHGNRKFYADWIRKGLMRETPGNMTDYARVRRDINEIADRFSIQGIAVDRLFQGAQLAMELQEDGFDVVSHGQGFLSMASPTLSFETRLRSGELMHDGNEVLRWMASNVSVELDAAGNMKPTKAKSYGKIDGIVTGIMALGMYESVPDDVSPYAKTGIVYA